MKFVRLVLICVAILLFVGGGGMAVQSAQDSTDHASIPYLGYLADEDDQPVSGDGFAFTFTLFDVSSGGDSLWSENHSNMIVQEGIFLASLGSTVPFPPAVWEATEYWLEIAVQGPDDDSPTTLTPRWPLEPGAPISPAAIQAGPTCAHDHWGETWSNSSGIGLQIQRDGSQVVMPHLFAALFAESPLNGVHGKSVATNNSVGVLGEGLGSGVRGISSNGFGGWFESDNDHLDVALGGAVGRINTDNTIPDSILILSSNEDVHVRLDNNGGGNGVFRIKDSGGGDVCTVDEAGNLNCTGGKSAMVQTEDYGQRLLYAVESAEVWFEDIGSASLVDGEAFVAFEPIFAQTVNRDVDYHVFATPTCAQPILLTVTEKRSDGFSVEGVNLDGSTTECAFDFRVVAKRLDFEDERLAPLSQKEEE